MGGGRPSVRWSGESRGLISLPGQKMCVIAASQASSRCWCLHRQVCMFTVRLLIICDALYRQPHKNETKGKLEGLGQGDRATENWKA